MAGGTRRSAATSVPPVLLYTLPGCVHCARARALLARRGIEYAEQSGTGVPGFRRLLADTTGGHTVPQIVIRGEPIGGADDLARLDRLGVLVPLARGEVFPVQVRRRRFSWAGLLRSLPVPGRRGHRESGGPWRWEVVRLDRSGAVVDRAAE